jgi:regulator of sigma E protease
MDFLTGTFNFVLIILGFGLLIFVHEAGHFLAAKWAGIRTEVFAVGMGTPVVSWRKGIGWALGSTQSKVVARAGKAPVELTDEELERHGIGETEYSLRWLPIGGFVKMLGQDDLDPSAVSARPRSYNVCPVPRRMVVISAGVIANIILALVLFVWAFMVGVGAEQPVVGQVDPSMPGAGLIEPGDRVLAINDREVRTFADIDIYVAMAKPEEPVSILVDRPALPEPLNVQVVPQKDPLTGLLGIGVSRGRSNTLYEEQPDGTIAAILEAAGFAETGLQPGMTLVEAAGQPVATYGQLDELVAISGGQQVPTRWRDAAGEHIDVDIPAQPLFQIMRYPQAPTADQNIERGLLGLVPLVEIASVSEGPNADVLEVGDVVLRLGPIDGPRMANLRAYLSTRAGKTVDLTVLRDGVEVMLEGLVDRKGRLNFGPGYAWDAPLIAQPMARIRELQGTAVNPTPVGDLMLMGRTRLVSVGETPVDDWADLRETLRAQTTPGQPATLSLTVAHPTPGNPTEDLTINLTADDVETLHELGWVSSLPPSPFSPMLTTLSAGGNPIRAVVMGFVETHKFLLMTYLTIDRLVRGSVGVEQIRGPVGIVHIGAKVADRGLMYLVFFLGIISVNLAVINFLPLPIVDGGLFLFLIYEKLKGRPPSIAFQNAATILGIALIATVLLVVTWNDVVRLVTGGM